MADTKRGRFVTRIAATTAVMASFAAVTALSIRVAVLLPGCDSSFLLKHQVRKG